jgi:hypothetical protein
MSRSGYTDEYDDYGQIARWHGQVASSSRGKRGQRFFVDLIAALDAMPERRLIRDELEADGGVCGIAALGRHRGVDLEPLRELVDEGDHDGLGEAFDIAAPLVAETMHCNDERFASVTPETRWKLMRAWAVENLTPETLLSLAEGADAQA